MSSKHRGREEVKRRKTRLDAVVAQIDGVDLGPELLAHFARYLTVLTSGYVEQATKELIREYSRTHGDPRLQRMVGRHVEKTRNIDAEKLKQLLDALDADWWPKLHQARGDDLDALGSIATLRNNIAHGGDSNASLVVVKSYIERIERVVVWLTTTLDPGQ